MKGSTSRLSNAQRKLGYRDEYVYNVNTQKFYERLPGENYREVTLPVAAEE